MRIHGLNLDGMEKVKHRSSRLHSEITIMLLFHPLMLQNNICWLFRCENFAIITIVTGQLWHSPEILCSKSYLLFFFNQWISCRTLPVQVLVTNITIGPAPTSFRCSSGLVLNWETATCCPTPFTHPPAYIGSEPSEIRYFWRPDGCSWKCSTGRSGPSCLNCSEKRAADGSQADPEFGWVFWNYAYLAIDNHMLFLHWQE